MKLELAVGVYSGDDLVDTVSYVLDSGALASIFATLPEDFGDVFLSIEGVKELCE